MPTNATPRAEPAISDTARSRAATYDVFVSHSSKDKSEAGTLCEALEAGGLRCWIAPRDIEPGRKWDESIMDGIAHSRVVLLVHSANANASDDVEREIVHASNAELPVLPVRLEELPLSKSMSYHLVQAQWLDAFPPPLADHVGMVVEAVRELVHRPPGSTAAPATVTDSTAATGTHSRRSTRPPVLRELVALPPLIALDIIVGVWVALNARGAIEWVTANAAIGGLIALLWKMLPDQTTERARYDFARILSSRKVAIGLTVGCVVFLISTAFVSTVHVTADASATGRGASRMFPATIHVHEPTGDSLGRPTDTEPNTLVIDSLRVATLSDELSAFVPISPLGRRVFLEASPRHRTRDIHLFPWVPRRVIYPADFEAPTLTVLPDGSLVNDITALPVVLVYRQDAPSDSVLIAQTPLRTMGSMQFSIASPPEPDSATRARWVRAVMARVGTDEATANEIASVWMDRRWVRTLKPLGIGDHLRVVVVSNNQTLSSDTLTLTASATDVYINRRP